MIARKWILLPPANEVWCKVILSQASVILFTGQGGWGSAYKAEGGLHLGWFTPRGSAHRGACLQGDLPTGGASRGVCLPVGLHPGGEGCIQVVTATRGICPQGGLPRGSEFGGGPGRGADPQNQKIGQYASCWNAFLFRK